MNIIREQLNTVLTNNVIGNEYRVHSTGKYCWNLLCVQCVISHIVNASRKINCLKLPCARRYSNRCGVK